MVYIQKESKPIRIKIISRWLYLELEILTNWSLEVLTITFPNPPKNSQFFKFIWQLYIITVSKALFSANILETDHTNYLICFLSPLKIKRKRKVGRGGRWPSWPYLKYLQKSQDQRVSRNSLRVGCEDPHELRDMQLCP